MSWESKWEVVTENLSQGGQGKTHHVRSKTSGIEGVVKVLHKKDDKQARARMAQEASNLQIVHSLNGRVPKLFDHNTQTLEGGEELFLVMEFVSGKRLDEFMLENGPCKIDSALEIIRKLSRTIKIAHDNNVIHRDIKPKNIIVQSKGSLEPVLLDFGLSFNIDEMTENTLTGETIDSRFLNLPERRIYGGDQRDKRSDVTLLCAVLLYLLNGGVSPVELLDPEGVPPHLRANLSLDSTRSDSRWTLMKIFFDRGFEWKLIDRFQSIDEFVDRLNTLEANSLIDTSTDFRKTMLLATDRITQSKPAIQRVKFTQNAIVEVKKFRRDLIKEFGPEHNIGDFKVTLNGNSRTKLKIPYDNMYDFDTNDVVISISFMHSTRKYIIYYVFVIDGNQIAILRRSEYLAPQASDSKKSVTIDTRWSKVIWFTESSKELVSQMMAIINTDINTATGCLENGEISNECASN